MRRRIMSVLLAMVVLVGALLNTSCGTTTPADVTSSMEDVVVQIPESAEKITRSDWIIALGSSFGMTEYITEEPYFCDVDSSTELYPFLQSCAEWNIFEKAEGNFEPDAEVSREFAIKTAVMSAEVLNHVTDETVYEQCIDYAIKDGILSDEQSKNLSETIDYIEAQKIIDWAVDEYNNREFVEYSNVEVNENVIDLADVPMDIVIDEVQDTTTITMPAEQQLENGAVFYTAPTIEAPYGVAYKVAGVTTDAEGNQVYEVVQPDISDLYKELDFAVVAVPEAGSVITYEGVEIASIETPEEVINCGNDYSINYATGKLGDIVAQKVAKSPEFGFTVNFTSGKPSLNAAWETALGKFTADLSETEKNGGNTDAKKAGELFKKCSVLYKNDGDNKIIEEISTKYSGGYEITGSVKIKNIAVDIAVEPEKVWGIITGIEEVQVNTHYTIESSLKLKGKLETEFKLSTIPIATPIPGVTVNIDVIVYSQGNGELEVKLVCDNDTNFSYASGHYKKTAVSDTNSTIEGSITLETGLALGVSPALWGIDIVDLTIKAGAKVKFSSNVGTETIEKEEKGELVTYKEWRWINKLECTAPIVKLEGSGKSSKALIKLKFSWELIGDKGLIKVKPIEVFSTNYIFGRDELDRIPLETTEESSTSEEEFTIETTETEESVAEENLPGECATESTDTSLKELIVIDTFMLTLNEGDSKLISVTVLPSGYSVDDLVWTTADASIATISSGTVTGKAEGTTTVTIATKDGQYSTVCAVMVSSTEQIEFEGL